MEKSFWCARWQANEIGFHQPDINVYLQNYWPTLRLESGTRVFVPLCGKSRDLLWLAGQGHQVLGVEISPVAVSAFFEENNLVASAQKDARFVRYQSSDISLLLGDFFDLNATDLDGISAVYDRASLIALPPTMRTSYAQHMAAVLAPGVSVLLIALDYPPQEMDGPPFAVSAAEVEALFTAHFTIELLAAQDILAENPRFQARGLSRLLERVYHLVRR